MALTQEQRNRANASKARVQSQQGSTQPNLQQRIEASKARVSQTQKPQPIQPAVKKDRGMITNLATDILKTPARVATNVVGAGKEALNLFDNLSGKESRFSKENIQNNQPFSGNLLGEVKGVGVEDGGGLSRSNLKDSLGTGLEAASYIPITKGAQLGFEAFKGAFKKGGGKIFRNSVVPLAKEGFLGGALGGGGSALQDDKGVLGTVAQAGIGAVIGGVTAPILSGLTTGIASTIRKNFNLNLFKGDNGKFVKEITQKDLENVLELTRDVNTSGVSTVGGKKTTTGGGDVARFESGNASDPSLFKGSETGKTQAEIQRAAQVAPYLKGISGRQPVQAIARLTQAGSEFAQNKMTPFLQESNGRVNFKEMNDFMRSGEVPVLFGMDASSRQVYKEVVDSSMEILKKQTRTGKDIYSPNDINNARKSIDDLIEAQQDTFGKESEKLRGLNAASKYVRNRINELSKLMIEYGDEDLFSITKYNQAQIDLAAFKERGIMGADKTIFDLLELAPTEKGLRDKSLFESYLKHQQAIIESRKNIAIRAQEQQGKSIFKQIINESPILNETVETAKSLAPGFLIGRGRGRGRGGSSNNSN